MNYSEGANSNVVDEDPYNLDDLKDNPLYDASAETLRDEPSDIGIFDMLIPNEPCFGNNFADYGENGVAAFKNTSQNITVDFALHAMKLVSTTSNIPKTLPRGRVDGYAFVTKSEPKYNMEGARMKMDQDSLGDQHGAYSGTKASAEKFIYQYDKDKDVFKMNRKIGYNIDKDQLYWKGKLKEGIAPIPHLIKGRYHNPVEQMEPVSDEERKDILVKYIYIRHKEHINFR